MTAQTLAGVDPQQLAAFFDTYLKKKYPHLSQQWHRGAVTAVSGQSAPGTTTPQPPFLVQIQRAGEDQADGAWYPVSNSGYVPQVGDQVDLQMRDANAVYASVPLSSSAAVSSMTRIGQPVVLTQNTTAVTWGASGTPIPQTFTHLVLVVHGRSTAAAFYQNWSLTVNADTGAHYSLMTLDQSDTSPAPNGVFASAANSLGNVGIVGGGQATPGTAGASVTWIPNYTSTLLNKVFITDTGRGDSGATVSHRVAFWYPPTPAAITQLTASAGTNQFVTGSTFELFGVL